MKRLLLFAILLLVANNAFSQLEVNPGSFKETIGFVNTNPDPDYQYDDNDLPFAVIKVRTENISDRQRRELIFEGNAGTFIMLEYKIGEVWVYLTAKYADYIKISHPELSSCEFTLPCDLLAKHGYEMTLVNKTANSSGSGTLIVTTKPENGATVTLNGKVQEQLFRLARIKECCFRKVICNIRHQQTLGVSPSTNGMWLAVAIIRYHRHIVAGLTCLVGVRAGTRRRCRMKQAKKEARIVAVKVYLGLNMIGVYIIPYLMAMVRTGEP